MKDFKFNEKLGNADYNQSIVVFLDILGFKNKIQSGDFKDVKLILEYMEAWNTLDGVNMFIEEKDFVNETYVKRNSVDFGRIQKELQISYFSDSLVITLPYIETNFNERLFLIVRSLAYLQSKLAMSNFFSRGGITIGDMFHKKNLFFGPAYLQAYELEQIATYPRIILSSEIEKKYDQNMPYLKKAGDNLVYVDFLRFASEISNSSVSIELIVQNIDSNINKFADNLKVMSKYAWLKSMLDKY